VEPGRVTILTVDGVNVFDRATYNMSQIIDLTGQTFGMLKVLRFTRQNKKKQAMWQCECTCGTKVEVLGINLRRGATKSCGCLRIIKRKENGLRSRRDLTNQKYNKLTVLEYSHTKNKKAYWKCKCECGKTIVASSSNIVQGQVKSCGCVGQETMLKLYGVENCSQNTEIRLRAAQSANKITTLKHWFSNEDIKCQGGWEVEVVKYFNKNHIDFNWQIQTFIMPNGRTYTPDCYLPDQDLWIEIKGFFMKSTSKEKWEWFHKENPNSELWNKEKLKEMGIRTRRYKP
jgi:hypothetical protein